MEDSIESLTGEGDLDRQSTNQLLNTKSSFSLDLTASYGSINSAHYDNHRPRVKSAKSFDNNSTKITSKIKKLFFQRVNSSTVEPEFEDDHVITRQDNKTNCDLMLFSIQHALKLFLVTLPTILVSCGFVIGYSFIPWTNANTQCNQTTNGTAQPCSNYHKDYLVYFNVYPRMVFLSVISVLLTTITLDGSRHLFRSILYVSVPLVTMTTALIPGLLKYNTVMMFYYTDTLLCGLIFLIGLTASMLCLYKNLEIQITRKRIFQVLILPSVIAVLGLNFLDGIVNKEYQMLRQGSIEQYIVRLVIYPTIVDILLAITELNIHSIPTNQNSKNNPSHVIYFYQVAYAFVGRYMTTMAGDIVGIIIMATTIMVKDIVFHRMGRIRCRIAYFVRSVLEKILPWYTDSVDYETFEGWFYSKHFTYFKANTLNNDFVIELVGVIIVPVIMATFKKHSAIYTFHDDSFLGSDGNLNITYIIQQEVIQISLVFIVVIILTYMEARFNRVNLSVVFKKKSKTQYLSEALINLWAVLLFLSSVKTTPNYLQCDDMTMCNCRFTADQDVVTKYGCP